MDYQKEYDDMQNVCNEQKANIECLKSKLSDVENLKEEIENERKHCENEIKKIDIEIAKLQSRRECYEDRKTMLWGFLN